MFFSGWQFQTPTGFDLSGQSAASAVAIAAPAASPEKFHAHTVPGTATRAAHEVSSGSASAAALARRGVVHVTLAAFQKDKAGPAATAAAAAAGRSRARGGGAAGGVHSHSAFHVRSDYPLMQQLGVAYMEVQVERVEPAPALRSGGEAPPTPPPLSLVVGICSDALPAHKLPGELEGSIGLFFAQSMVYSNGLGEGERVRLPAGDGFAAPAAVAAPGSAKGADGRVGSSPSPADVGAAGVASPPLADYFAAARGPQRSHSSSRDSPGEEALPAAAAAASRVRRRELRVGDTLGVLVDFLQGTLRFTHNGSLVEGYVGTVDRAEPSHSTGPRAARGRASLLRGGGAGTATGAHQYYFAVGLQRKPAAPVTLKAVFQSGVLPVPGVRVLSAPPRVAPEGPTPDPVVFDVARYATREAERRLKRHCPRLRERSWCEGDLQDGATLAMLRQFFAARGLSKSLAALEREAAQLCCPRGRAEPQGTSAPDPLLAYSDFIATARGRGPGTAAPPPLSPALVLQHHWLLPTHRAAFAAALRTRRQGGAAGGERDGPGPAYWGLLLFSRRMDLLFTLKAVQAAEMVLDTCEKYLTYVAERHGQASAEWQRPQPSAFDNPAAVESKLLAAYSAAVLLPMEDIAKCAGRHAHAASAGPAVPPSSRDRARRPPWHALAQLPHESLRCCFLDCLHSAASGDKQMRKSEEEAPQQQQKRPASTMPPTERQVGEAEGERVEEVAAAALLTAALPLLAAPTTAAQLRLGEALVSFFAHEQAFFAQLTGARRAGGPASRDSLEEEEEKEKEARGGSEPVPAAAHATGEPPSANDVTLLSTCLRNWGALIARARHQYRQRSIALLQRSLEEGNHWVGATLRAWLADAAARDAVQRDEEEEEREGMVKSAAETYSSSEDGEEDDCEESRNRQRHAGGAAAKHRDDGVLATLTRAPALPAYPAGASADTRGDGALLRRLPPGHPSFRAVLRRALATASLDPLTQMSTTFFLARLAAAGRRVGAERAPAVAHGAAAETAGSAWKRTAPPLSASTSGTTSPHESRAGWAADEFYIASAQLQRVYRSLFP